MPDPPPLAPPLTDAPPTYAPEQPQILVAPLPDSPSFFWGRTIQGEVFVKGLGERRGNRGVKRLTARLDLTDSLPGQPTVALHEFPLSTLYPPFNPHNESTSAPPAYTDLPFSSSHRFAFVLPPSFGQSPTPGTLNLTASRRGEVKYTLTVILALASGTTVEEVVPIEGTPQDVAVEEETEAKEEAEAVLERDGVKARFVVETDTPRLGDLVRLGVEVKPMERQKKTSLAGLSAQPNPADTLRPLRRVRVELFRRVKILDPSVPSSSSASSSSTAEVGSGSQEHLTLMWSSGKSLRFPGTSRARPPLRVLFTLPTAQLGSVAGETFGEITSATIYHQINFFIRVTIGFGDNPAMLGPGPSANAAGPSSSSSSSAAAATADGPRDWFIERDLTIRPKLWVEPREIIIQGGRLPATGLGDAADDLSGLDEATRRAYRAKGLDIVGDTGTYRAPEAYGEGGDAPPPPGPGPGPSGTIRDYDQDDSPSSTPFQAQAQTEAQEQDRMDLPSFSESQAQMHAGDAPTLANGVPSERLAPIQFEDDRANTVGRRGSLGGELGTWVEYDGYETFSMAPPSAAVSFGLASSMDPPQEGDEDMNVMGGMAARLGLAGDGVGLRPGAQAELMEQLGLGEGTRVVDLQDDLPPGIDEPSLPGLPDFHSHTVRYSPPPPPSSNVNVTNATPEGDGDHDNPPSFAASEAAQAVGGVASAQPAQRRMSASVQHSHSRQQSPPPPSSAAGPPPPAGGRGGQASEAPPGYFGAGGGLPPYSQG